VSIFFRATMTMFASPLSYKNNWRPATLGLDFADVPRTPWKASSQHPLGQPVTNPYVLRNSTFTNVPTTPPAVAACKPWPPALVPCTPPPSDPALCMTPVKPHLYTNDPYSLEHFTPPPKEAPVAEATESDTHKIEQRLKQIGFGKSTKGYEKYTTLVLVHQREYENEDHPVTPRADQKCSKRSWDGQLKKWRRQLHRWDNVRTMDDLPHNPLLNLDWDGSEMNITDEDTPRLRPAREYVAVSLMDHYPSGSDASDVALYDDGQDFMEY
jgi:hypothetical protein